MYKSTVVIAVLALAAFAQEPPDPTVLRLKEEVMILEYTATAHEAVVIIEAEAEVGMEQIEIRDPSGQAFLELRAAEGHELSLQGFLVETRESTPASLVASYPEGDYSIRARSVEGQPVLGRATLSHRLLYPPVIAYPTEGATGVPTSNLVVSWVDDPQASGYRVGLEQDENDGLVVQLPPGSTSFAIPDGYLAPNTETQLEVGVLAPNGNCTITEVFFTTQ